MLKKRKEKTSQHNKQAKLLKNPIKAIDTTIISASGKFEGRIETEGTLIVEGSVRGRIKCSSLEIISQGNVEAEVYSEDVSVAGQFEGKMLCNGRLTVLGTGKVAGDISYGTLSMQAGGLIDGTVSRFKAQGTSVLPFYQEDCRKEEQEK
jgi:cytoskeletal protein CcmA (bactofilin family)